MKIIAQKSDAMNSEEFFRKSLSTNYIDGINLNNRSVVILDNKKLRG